jgi:hypothetical protein
MSNSTITLYRGAAATSSATLYTAPTDTAILMQNVVVTNTSTSAATYTITINGVAIASSTALASNSTHYIDLQQVIYNGEVLAASASSTSVAFNISGSDVK